jgi:hypothetical protein
MNASSEATAPANPSARLGVLSIGASMMRLLLPRGGLLLLWVILAVLPVSPVGYLGLGYLRRPTWLHGVVIREGMLVVVLGLVGGYRGSPIASGMVHFVTKGAQELSGLLG